MFEDITKLFAITKILLRSIYIYFEMHWISNQCLNGVLRKDSYCYIFSSVIYLQLL